MVKLPDQQKERDNKQQRGNQRGQQQQQRKQTDVQQLQEDLKQTQQQKKKKQVIKEEPPEYWQQELIEEEDLLEDWQRQVEEDQPVECLNWSEAETDTKEKVLGPPASQKNEWDKRGTEGMMRKEKKQRMISMAVPFLTGVSSAGILSANKKQSGGSDHVIRVNGKDYPLAKVQLGMMGALHPANRLAAYLMGRVGSATKKTNSTVTPSSSSSCSKSSHSKTDVIPEKPLQPKSLAASLASSVAAARPATQSTSVQPATVLSLPALPMGVQPDVNTDKSQTAPSTVPVDPVQLAGKAAAVQKEAGTRVVTLKVIPAATTGTSQVKAVSGANSSSGPTSGTHNLIPVPIQLHNLPTVGQKMVVRAAAGVQLFRRSDGKLVQLIPVNQLASMQSVTSAKIRPAAIQSVTSLQHPPTSVINQTTPLVTPPLVTALSGFQSFTVSHINTSAQPSTSMLHQQGTCTFKILPAGNTSDRLIITCPPVPTQTKTTNMVPAAGSVTITPVRKLHPVKLTSQQIESDINRVAKKAIQDRPCTVIDLSKIIPQEHAQDVVQTIPPIGTINNNFAKHGTSGPSTAAPHLDSEANPVTFVSPQPHPSNKGPTIPELACDLVDLDIVCVDVDTGLCTRRGTGACAGGVEPSQGKKQMKDMEVVDLVESASSSTEDSSEFEDDLDSESEKVSTDKNNTEKNVARSAMEKTRRQELWRFFSSLKKELTLSKESSKINVLTKATLEIKRLKATEKQLLKQKRRLTEYRDYCLNIIAPKSGTGQNSFQQDGIKKKIREEADLIEVMDLSEDTDHSSDEDCTFIKNINIISSGDDDDDDDVQMVTMETEESSQLKSTQQQLARKRNPDSIHISEVKTCLGEQTDSCLQSSLHSGNEPGQVSCPQPQRPPEQEQDRLKNTGAVKEPPTVGSDAEDLVGPGTRTNPDHVPSTPSQKVTTSPAAPPTSEATHDPASTASQHHHTNIQTDQSSTDTGTSHNAPGTRDRQKTIPNILSRSKQRIAVPHSSCPPTNTEGDSASSLVSMAPPSSPTRKDARPRSSTGSDQSVDHVEDQNQVLVQTEGLRPECSAASPAGVSGTGTSLRPQQNAENGTVVVSQGVELEQAGDDTETLTSLLNEIDFLNQHSRTTTEAPAQTSFLPQEGAQTTRTPPAGLQDFFIESPPGVRSSASGAEEQEHAHSPWLLELDEDSDEANATEMKEVEPKRHTETKQHKPSPESFNRSWTELAPPPLLQMKVGRSTVAESSSRDGSVGEIGRESSAAWRPMPRLVPLGLRGNPPS